MWECALNPASKLVLPEGSCFPPMHQISRRTKRDSSEEFLKAEFPPVRYLRKFSFGGSLNLFVTPKGGRYWRYCEKSHGVRFDCGVAELVDNRYLARRRPTITPRSCDTINPAT